MRLKKDFVMALKSNRLVALSEQDKVQGHFVALSDLELKVWSMPFGLPQGS